MIVIKHRKISSFACLALVCLAIAPPASANHGTTCATATPIDGNEPVTGTVYDWSIGPSSLFYVHTAGQYHQGYALLAGAAGPHVQANLGDAYLNVWNEDCTWLYCSSWSWITPLEECLIGGVDTHVIEVGYGWSHESHVDFTLVALN